MAYTGFSTTAYPWISVSPVNNLLPFSHWCWFVDPVANATVKSLTAISNVASNTNYGGLNIVSGTLRFTHATGTPGLVVSSNTYPTTGWNGGGGVYASPTMRSVFLNGVKTSNATSSTPVNSLPQLSVGVRRGTTPTVPATGGVIIAEVGVWDIALTDAEFAALYSGVSPLSVRPQSLRHYWPLVRDIMDTQSIPPTLVGSITPSPHPRIYK